MPTSIQVREAGIRSVEEVTAEINALLQLQGRVKGTATDGCDQLACIDAMIDTLLDDPEMGEIEDKYEDDDNEREAAETARYWLDGDLYDDEGLPVDTLAAAWDWEIED